MGTPYKMKGSPMARNFGAPFRDDKKVKTVTTRGKNSIIKTKGDKSSTYNKTSSKENRDGSVTEVYTNDLGNTETRNVSTPIPQEKPKANTKTKTKTKKIDIESSDYYINPRTGFVDQKKKAEYLANKEAQKG